MKGKILYGVITAILMFVRAAMAERPDEIRSVRSDKVSHYKVLGKAGIPHQINYQGYLTDGAANAITDNLDMTFRIYNAFSGGTELWSETHTSVSVTDGLFNVLLGGVTSIPSSVFSNPMCWLETQIEAEVLEPRKELVSVGYAFRADTAGHAEHAMYADSAGIIEDIWVNEQGPDGMEGSSAFPMLWANNTGGGPGVHGNSGVIFFDPPTGSIGVYGSGHHTGIFGLSDGTGADDYGGSFAGHGGVKAVGSKYGVYGETSSNDVDDAGLYGYSTGTASGVRGTGGIGVKGEGMTGIEGNGDVGVKGNGITGVWGHGSLGYGVQGESNNTFAIYGTTGSDSAAIRGKNTGEGDGVFGSAIYYDAIGVYGVSGFGTGVKGVGENGVVGESGLGPGVHGRGVIGVSGYSEIGTGVHGQGGSGSTNYGGYFVGGRGGYFEATASYSPGIYVKGKGRGVEVYAGATNYAGVSAHASGGTGTNWAGYFYGNVHVNGNLTASGTKPAVVKMEDGQHRCLYSMESSELWFEDFGSGRLQNGLVTVYIEPIFAQTINTDLEYHVFLTPEGDCNGLYVINKTPVSFEVRELRDGTSNISFSYRVVAKRRGYESRRLEIWDGSTTAETSVELFDNEVQRQKNRQ